MEIISVHLHTHRLPGLVNFYREVLGFPVTVAPGQQSAIIQIGNSQLVFKSSNEAAYHHFAFNIPFALFNQAFEWLKERVKLLPYNDELIVPFDNWDAKAMYFHDPAGNIVEYIARGEIFLELPANAKFSPDYMMEISEIGLPVADVPLTCDHLKALGLDKYDGDDLLFNAMGDPTGLFIVVDKEQKTWLPTHEKATPYSSKVIFRTMPGGNVFVLRLHPGGKVSYEPVDGPHN